MESALAQHPPAVKVGGRRLSVSNRQHKPHVASPSETTQAAEATTNSENVDYPRPAAPGEEPAHHDAPPHEEEAPKKEKKHGHGNHENEKKLRDAQRKAEARPTRDSQTGPKNFGGAGRIAQPAGKGFF